MDIFEFAKEKEEQAELLYRDLALKSPDEGLHKIFSMLADEEEKHYEVIEAMQAQTDVEIAQTPILDNVIGIFEKIRDSGKKFNFDKSQIKLYQQAEEIEAHARDFYYEKAQEVENPAQKDIFLQLAEQEKNHYMLIDNLVEFVSRPTQWLENAEFYHLEDY